MSERKYRQNGYQDSGARDRRPAQSRPAKEPYDPRIPRDPRTPNMPSFRQVFRCGRCGHLEPADVKAETTCSHCGVELHACVHCASFDAGATFECNESIPARVSPKDRRNTCSFFAVRVSVERETHSTPAASSSGARKAFDDLFKI